MRTATTRLGLRAALLAFAISAAPGSLVLAQEPTLPPEENVSPLEPSEPAPEPTDEAVPAAPPALSEPAVREPLPAPPPPRTGMPFRGPSSSYVPGPIGTRLSALDANLFALGQRGGNAIVDGVLSTIAGGLLLTVGVLADDRRLSTYFYLWGGSSLARGLVHFTLRPNASDAAIEFAHMPMNTREEVEARLLFGEAALERLARKARAARLVDGTLSLGVGIAVLPLYFAPNGFRFETGLDYFAIIGSGLSIVSGILSLAIRSEAERRWRAYRLLRDRLLAAENATPRVRLEAGAMPLPGGGGLVLGGRF